MAAFSGLTDSRDIDEKDQDIELWRVVAAEKKDETIVFITPTGELGLRVNGRSVAMPIDRWHELAMRCR